MSMYFILCAWLYRFITHNKQINNKQQANCSKSQLQRTANTRTVEKSEILVVLDEDAFSNIDKFHDGSENIDEDDVSDESVDVAEEDWTGLD